MTGTHRVQLRWQDIDGLGHVGHPAALILLEEGRDAFLKACGIGRDEYVVGRCEVTYHGEIALSQGHVDASCAVVRAGRSSITTREALLGVDGDVLVEATFGIVLWDPAQRVSRAITDGERRLLAPEEEPAP